MSQTALSRPYFFVTHMLNVSRYRQFLPGVYGMNASNQSIFVIFNANVQFMIK